MAALLCPTGRTALTPRPHCLDPPATPDPFRVGGRERKALAALASHDIVLTTYPTLDKCTVALESISWCRVFLDELQEVDITDLIAAGVAIVNVTSKTSEVPEMPKEQK